MIEVNGTYIMESAVAAMKRRTDGEYNGIEVTLTSGDTLYFNYPDQVECHMEFQKVLALMEAYQRQTGQICPDATRRR